MLTDSEYVVAGLEFSRTAICQVVVDASEKLQTGFTMAVTWLEAVEYKLIKT